MTHLTGNELPGRDHERARDLAAARPGGFLDAEEAAWLDAHLATCNACLAVAGEFEVQRDLFAGLRGVYPEPPRDLWARTAAAIDAESGRKDPVRRGARGRGRPFGSWTLAPIAAVMVVAIAVGAGLLNGLPLRESTSKGDEPDATPFALAAGEIRVLSQAEDGSLELRRQVVNEVCPVAASTCTVTPTDEVTQTERIAGASAWDAIISPTNDQLVVVEKGDGAQGVYVVPLRDTASASSPKPVAPTAPPATEPPATATPTEPPATETPAATESPADTATATPGESASADTSASPEASADVTESPSAAPESAAPSPSDEPTASPAPAATPKPTPTIGVTPRPDGAIEIARDVTIVGGAAAYSPDGTHFAFTARPSDGSRGPDVYVWETGDTKAVALTDDHASLFSGWLGADELLVSRVVDKGPRTFIVGLDGSETPAHDGAMWRPSVAPDGRTGVWWDGSVKAAKGGEWTPANGRLVLESWPRGGAEQQVLAKGAITDWQVRWDDGGTVLAVWTTTGAPGDPGTLSLYPVDPKTGAANLDAPTLSGEAAFAGFSLKPGRLTWSAPADGGDTTVQVLAWSGDKVGRVEILAEDGTTVVR